MKKLHAAREREKQSRVPHWTNRKPHAERRVAFHPEGVRAMVEGPTPAKGMAIGS
jgi:hypothetical protein